MMDTERFQNLEAVSEWQHRLAPLLTIFRSIDVEKIERILEYEQRSHTLMPILDPTAYMQQLRNPNVERNVKIMRAFVTFRKTIDPILDEAQQAQQDTSAPEVQS